MITNTGIGSTGQVDAAGRVRERLEDQARDHWHEFSIIVASVNMLLALTLFGRILIRESPGRNLVISLGIAVASTLAVMLAYYSIQVGALFMFGPLSMTQVLLSFLIATVQSALFVWPTYALSVESSTTTSELNRLRHWLLFFSTFAFAAAVANWHNGRIRRRIVGNRFADFEASQDSDRIKASLAGSLVAACWVLSYWWPAYATGAGLVIALVASVFGLGSQARTSARILSDLPSASSAPPSGQNIDSRQVDMVD